MVKMISGKKFAGRRVLVVGLGLHGGAASAVRWFAQQGANLRIQDIKTRAELVQTIKRLRGIRATYHLGGHSPEDFDWAEYIYLNQGVGGKTALDLVSRARNRGVEILNETTIFFDACPCPIIGITGTRGKSTTTVLLGQIITEARRSVKVAGNLRQSMMLDILPKLVPTDLALLELSSFQLEHLLSIKRSPQVAIMTNLKVDHLNRYATMQEYADAKYNIFRWQRAHDIAVLNAENIWTRQAADMTNGQVWWFQRKGHRGTIGLTISAGWVIEYHGSTRKRLFPVSSIRLAGSHNLENILAAACAARAMNISPDVISRSVKTFNGIPHRQELVRTWRGHRFINDTTATTPDGTLAALDVYPNSVFIVGGTDKKLTYGGLASRLQKEKSLVFLPGTGTEKILSLFPRSKSQRTRYIATSMKDAVTEAIRIAKPGQAIVLSPGAASFGLFVHEFDRGEQFVHIVKALR